MTTPADFPLAAAAFAAELADHADKGEAWTGRTHTQHLLSAFVHLRDAIRYGVEEDILHAQSRIIFAVEQYLRTKT
jgi:hypothetical protein